MSKLKIKNKYIKIIIMSLCLILPLSLGLIVSKLNSNKSEMEAIKIEVEDNIKHQVGKMYKMYDINDTNKDILETTVIKEEIYIG